MTAAKVASTARLGTEFRLTTLNETTAELSMNRIIYLVGLVVVVLAVLWFFGLR